MSLLTMVILGSLGLLFGIAIRHGFEMVHRRFRFSGRLLGLRLIAIYELCIGLSVAILTLLATYSVITRYDEIQRNLIDLRIGPLQLLGDLFAITILALTAGIGLMLETRWGWEIATFAISTAVARNILSLLLSKHAINQLDQAVLFFYTQHSLRALIEVDPKNWAP